MRKPVFALIALGLTAGFAATQTCTIPPGHETKEGDHFFYRIGYYNSCRQQIIYAKSQMPKGPYQINSFKIRRDADRTGTYVAHNCKCDLYMSNNLADPMSGYGKVWSLNRGKDYTKVISNKIIKWDAPIKPVTAPAPWSVSFILDKPFTYTGNAFMVEFDTDKETATSPDSQYWYADAVNTYAGIKRTNGSRTTIGTACPTNFNTYCAGTGTPFIADRWQTHALTRNTTKALPCLLMLGVSDKTWGPMTLPFDLAGLGAKGCNIYNDCVMTWTANSDPKDTNGKVNFEKGVVPLEPILVGASYFEQVFAIDPAYNALGVMVSHGNKFVFGSEYSGTPNGVTFFGFHASWHVFDKAWPYVPESPSQFVLVMLLNG